MQKAHCVSCLKSLKQRQYTQDTQGAFDLCQSSGHDKWALNPRAMVGSIAFKHTWMLVLLLIILIAIPSVAGAASVTLAWDPNQDSPDSYRVFLRTSGQSYNYTYPDWKGSATQCTVDQLENGKTYFAVVRAYKGTMESSNSNEVQFATADAPLSATGDQTSGSGDGSNQDSSSGTGGTQSGTYTDIVIDNGDSGTYAKGSWSKSSASGAYGTRSLYSRDPSATYTFQAQTAGSYEVSLWWTQLSSRSDNVPVEIYDGSSLLEVVYVNQKIDGGQWNVLGTYQFSDYPKVVIVSTGDGSTCADAVEFMSDVPVDNAVKDPGDGAGNTSGSDAADLVVDDGDSGTSAKGSWSKSKASGAYGTQSLYSREASATYTFQAHTAGSYEVSLWWTQLSSRSDKVPVKIYDGSSLLEVVYVNQQIDGGQWNVLGTYQFSDYPKVVIVSTGDGSTCADAVEFISDVPVGNVVIDPAGSDAADLVVDDGDSGATAKGSWSKSKASGAYGTRSMYSREASATYTFQAHTAGSYEVSLWWTQLSSRSDNVPVKIYDGGSLLEVVYVNQTKYGGRWNVLGTYRFSDYPKVVIVSTGDGSTCADAVKYSWAP